ncbi:hypothetical protein [Motilimonas pumila]|uniref:DUF1311 domain-containing protein n=1 Tax=Motilimonas pumila TaxID=2303987 RepID=A0A418YHC4_9GAMM|nr:hypothetical protein [Motilimonas pumila]RJG49488.1 hypothetical protein D1Z90_05895 [Motilimonas pumila]
MKPPIFLSAICLLLSACSENDLAFYQTHIEDAKAKLLSCRLTTETNDNECYAAKVAVDQYAVKHAYSIKQQVIAKQQTQYKAFIAEFSKLPYRDFLQQADACSWSDLSPKCQALNELKEAVLAKEIARLKLNFKSVEMDQYQRQACRGGISFNKDVCHAATVAMRQQKTEAISRYLANKEVLAKDFTACRLEFYQAIEKDQFKNEKGFLNNRYHCYLAAKAANQLGVYSLNESLDVN